MAFHHLAVVIEVLAQVFLQFRMERVQPIRIIHGSIPLVANFSMIVFADTLLCLFFGENVDPSGIRLHATTRVIPAAHLAVTEMIATAACKTALVIHY
jgi:hypothetical protein